MHTGIAAGFAVAFLAGFASAQTAIDPALLPGQELIVAPVGAADVEGTGSNYWPWNQYGQWLYLHVQEIYDSTNFTSQGIAGPVRISALRYRANGSQGATWGGGIWPNVTVDMSTAAVDYRAPSLTFAQNHGPDRMTVLAGSVVVGPGPGRLPGPWYVAIPIQPFVYDPSSGADLVVDIEIQGLLLGTSFHVDHVMGTGQPPALGTRLLTVSSGSPDGSSISIDYTPVTGFVCERLAVYRPLAAGCAGSNGVPTNQATSLPLLGGTMDVVIGNVPSPSLGVLALGWSSTISSFGPLPLDLASYGAPGCFLRVATDLPALLLGVAGTAAYSLHVPNSLSLLGLRLHTQALVADPAANALGIVASDAAVAHFGF
jgi:hypothetical protein